MMLKRGRVVDIDELQKLRDRPRGPPFWRHRVIWLMNARLRGVHGHVGMVPWGG
jgi:hypothetical protein